MAEVVRRVIRCLYDLNRLALVTRYGDSYDPAATLRLGPGRMLDVVGLIKALNCLAYQCGEYLTADTTLYAHLQTYIGELAAGVVARLPAYDRADWEVAA